MAIKIEGILIVTIGILITGSFMMKLNDTVNKENHITKELAFTNTTFIEVDTKKLQGKAYGTQGVRNDGVLTIYNLRYESETIRALKAEKGIYMRDIIYLEGNVEMNDTKGYHYTTQQAEYNQNSEILNITAPFVVIQNKTIIKGDTFMYDTRKKDSAGTMIDATLYTVEK
jgi:lipopolysaccharide assembly outer membrane protein LptD (OstA)